MRDLGRRAQALFDAWWPYLLTGVATAIVLQIADPITRDESHYWRMWLAVAGIGLVGLRALLSVLKRPAVGVALLRGTLVVGVVVGVGNYYQFDRDVLWDFGDYTDPAYYYLNSKYFDELGYFGLYPAMLVADKGYRNRHAGDIRNYRDLSTYELRPVQQALAEGRRIQEERFTPERWEAFRHDNDFFLSRLERKQVQSNFFVDHGYNPPPTWSLIGGTLARLAPVEQLKVICAVDVVLMVGALLVVGWAFGFETMLLAALFFVCTFSGRWPILGQSILRFDWLAALLVGFCLFRRGRAAGAGGFLAYAALNRIFPVIFLVPWVLVAARDAWRGKRVEPRDLRGLGGLSVVALALVGGAAVLFGPSAFTDSSRNLLMHNRSYSSHRVGMGDVLVYRGERNRKEINANGGIALKEERVQGLQWPLRGVGLAALGFIAWVAWRGRREDWELIALGALPLFCVTNAQINYWNLRLVLIAWHACHADARFHRVALVLLFAVEVATQWTKVEGFDRYVTTTTSSYGLALYFLALILWLARDTVAAGGARTAAAAPPRAVEG